MARALVVVLAAAAALILLVAAAIYVAPTLRQRVARPMERPPLLAHDHVLRQVRLD